MDERMNTIPRNDFLLEIGTEEIPARMARKAVDDLGKAITDELTTMELSFDSPSYFVTPRRLVVILRNVPEAQEDRVEERRGPSVKQAFSPDGTPTKAAEGFARSTGRSLAELERTEIKGEAYLLARIEKKGQRTLDLLAPVVTRALSGLRFPRSMRWGCHKEAFVRPLHWIVALLGDRVVPFEFGGIASGNQTWGHRFLGSGKPVQVHSADDYLAVLKDQFVVLDPNQRREFIAEQAHRTARELGMTLLVDEGLLDTVTHLVEYPVVLTGKINDKFLKMPDEVLISSMKNHQKFFSLIRDGRLANRFVVVANTQAKDPARVVRGNERVLTARLEDALFFYGEDLSKPLETYLETLKGQTFMLGLGTMHDKSLRIARLARLLAGRIAPDLTQISERAGLLCKADLATQLVCEFPELQGIMGRDYALAAGEPPEVADAILEHYLPRFSGDALPATVTGQLVGLADRLDTLAGTFSLGLIPTATKDPYALRRGALAILRILAETPILLPVSELLRLAVENLEVPADKADALVASLTDFVIGRLKFWLSGQVATEVADASMEAGAQYPHDTWKKALAIEALRANEDYGTLILPFKRTLNITKQQPESGPFDTSVKLEPAEAALWTAFQAKETEFEALLEARDFDGVLRQFLALKEPIDRYFDEVLVLCDDPAARRNHLAMLSRIGSLFLRFADFTRILA
jgi:glycyl-tRNA synthetase beta chain